MKHAITVVLLVATLPAGAQMYKCPTGSGNVYQETPCKGASMRSVEIKELQPAKPVGQQPSAPGDVPQHIQRERDSLARMTYDREKREATYDIQQCEKGVISVQSEIDSTVAARGGSPGDSVRGLLAAQLYEERKQTAIAGLQSQITTKRRECDDLKKSYSDKFKK